jgi:hypothetical protein
MFQFFWAAGVVIRREHTGQIGDFPKPETDAWFRAVDRIAWRHAYEVLARAVADNARYGGNLEAVPLPQEHGFAITRGRERIAVIHPTRASVPGRPPVYGNFLAPGPHRGKVAHVPGATLTPPIWLNRPDSPDSPLNLVQRRHHHRSGGGLTSCPAISTRPSPARASLPVSGYGLSGSLTTRAR